jgi:hypothetical protein
VRLGIAEAGTEVVARDMKQSYANWVTRGFAVVREKLFDCQEGRTHMVRYRTESSGDVRSPSHGGLYMSRATATVGEVAGEWRGGETRYCSHVAAARSRLRLTVTTVRALQRLGKPWVVALKQGIVGVEHATALVGGPPGLVVVFVAESDDALARLLDIALSSAKELIEAGSTTWGTPLIAVARHMEEGVVEHDAIGADVVRAWHLGEHLALMPVHEPAPGRGR